MSPYSKKAKTIHITNPEIVRLVNIRAEKESRTAASAASVTIREALGNTLDQEPKTSKKTIAEAKEQQLLNHNSSGEGFQAPRNDDTGPSVL